MGKTKMSAEKYRGYIFPWHIRIWFKIRRIFEILHLCKPLKFSWYEKPGKAYINPKAVEVIKK